MTQPDISDSTLTRGQANLLANQAGNITAQQKDWLKHDMQIARNRYRQQIVISGLVALVVMIVLMVIPFPIMAPILSLFIWGILVAGWYVYAWNQHQPIRNDMAQGVVKSVTGYIDKKKQQGYYVSVAGEDYVTPPEMYEAFNDSYRYIVYVLPESKIVLSAEIAPETDNDYKSDEHI